MRGIRKDVHDALRLARVMPKDAAKVKTTDGLQWIRKSTSSAVFFCAQCGAPVVTTLRARKAHAARLPGCLSAMEQG
jgi:hypothetical protein